MKRFIARGLIVALTVLFSIFNNPMRIYPEIIKTNELEPLNAQMMMDILVKESRDERKEELLNITTEEAQMLMKIAQAEAGIDGREGMAMIMAVVLNRVKDERFPNDIEGVIFQIYKGNYQFSTIANGKYYDAIPDIECHLALADIEKGNYNNIDALYFENAKNSWQQNNCIYLVTVGHHRFYKN